MNPSEAFDHLAINDNSRTIGTRKEVRDCGGQSRLISGNALRIEVRPKVESDEAKSCVVHQLLVPNVATQKR
jgi:hypothetical protein